MMSERGNRKRGLGRQRRRVFLLLLGCVLLQHVAGAATAEHGGDEDDNGGDAATRVAGALAQDSAKDAVERENEEDEEQDLLAGYVNDFNMQHEASIPEDILDQRHIDEVDQAGDEDQEFILESQRSTSGSFTSYDNSNNIDNNNGRNRNDRSNNNKNYAGAEARDGVADDEVHRPKKKKASNRNHYKNFKKTAGKNNNNNDRNNRAKKISNVGDNNDDDDDGDDDAAMRRNSNGNRGNFEDGDNENTQSVSLMSSGSIKDDKLKNKQRQAAEAAGRQRQQLDAVADLNERKFNKLPAAAAASEDNEDDNDDVDVLWRDNSSSSRNRNNNSDSDKNIAIDKENFDDDDDINEDDEGGDEELKQQQQHFIDDAVGRTAVGDIEESFANEGAVGPSQESGAADSGGGAAVVGAGELGGAASATSTSATTMGPTTTTTASTTPTMTTTAFPQFVGRKSKRHGARPQSRFFSVAAVPNGEGKLQKMTAPSDRSSRNHRYPGISISSSSSGPNYQQRQQEGPDPANGSLSPKKLRGGDDHDDDEDVDEASHDRADEPLIQDKAEDVTPGNRFDSAALETTTPSAFEHHKAQRRNGRRSGHKSHKKRYKDYLRYVIATEATTTTAAASPTDTTVADGGDRRHQQRLAKWQSYKSDLRALAKARRLPAASAPIFVVASRAADDADDGGGNATGRPYYEGQLSYYLETRDGDGDGDGDEGMARGLADEDVGKLVTSERDGNWYRRGSPILRNGMANVQDKYRQHGHHSHGHNHNHHIQHQHQHQPHQHQHHHQHHHQYQQQQHLHRQPGKHQQHHAYQRRLPASRKTPSTEQQPLARSRQQPAAATAATSPSELQPGYRAGHKGAMQELGHQITQMEEFDRYYRKWPHLARVQYQLNDENYREAHPEAYEYVDQRGADEAYDELDVDVDADGDGEGDEDANLPPYIKKYNRRNKQLLNLLEGTLPPPTPPTRPPPARVWSSSVLQPGPRDAAYYWKTRGRVPGGDDEAEGGRRRGDSEDWRAKDSFAEQRLSTVAPTSTAVAQSSASPAQLPNSIPGEDVDLSSQEFDNWEKEIEARMTGSEKMRWQIEKATPRPSLSRGGSVPTTMTTTTTTLKPAVFRLPSYPTFAGGFVGKPRSRSAQFAPSAGGVGRGNGFISSTLHGAGSPGGYKSRPPYGLAAQAESAEDTHEPYNANYSATNTNGNSDNIYSSGNNRKYGSDAGGSSASASGSGSGSGSKAINNAFVYHRVEAAPRLVGAGPTGHKQRLPFVAITDRRLETAKKALTERQRDFEQNHYPMP